jgi:hypothetical protein
LFRDRGLVNSSSWDQLKRLSEKKKERKKKKEKQRKNLSHKERKKPFT